MDKFDMKSAADGIAELHDIIDSLRKERDTLREALVPLMEYWPMRTDFQPTPRGDWQFEEAIRVWTIARAAIAAATGETPPSSS